jgi:hypothetical protein
MLSSPPLLDSVRPTVALAETEINRVSSRCLREVKKAFTLIQLRDKPLEGDDDLWLL